MSDQPVPGVAPEPGPGLGVAQFTVGVASVACHESGELRAAGGLAGRVVAQVEAPAYLVADVGRRAVDGVLVHQDHVGGTGRDGSNPVEIQQRVGDGQRAARYVRAVGSQRLPVAARDHLQTAALHGCIRQRDPHREHVGVVGDRVHHAVVLVPRVGARQHVGGTVGEQALGRLDAYVLDRVGVDFGADEALDQIQHPLVGDDAEHRRPRPERRVRRDSGGDQAGIEVPGVVASALPVDADQSLGEFEIVAGGSELAAGVQFVRQAVEHRGVLGKQRLDVRRGFQHTSTRR